MKTKLMLLSLLAVITFLACITGEPAAMAAGDILPLGTEGPCNTFYGAGAGAAGAAGDCNTFIGANTGSTTTTGATNTFIGYYSGHFNVSGSRNTYLGFASGRNSTGTANVFLGYQAGFYETGNNTLYIANTYTTIPLIYGEFDTSIVQINGTLFVASDERLKKGIEPLNASLDKVLRLRGVSYEWSERNNKGRGVSNREIGLLAQEVETVLPELVRTDNKGYKAVAYDKLVPVLIEAVKEQQKGFEKALSEKDSRIERLEQALALMEKRLAAVEQPARTIASK